MSITYFDGKVVKPEDIRTFIERAKFLYPHAELNKAWLFRKLESTHAIIVGTPDFLDNRT
ncbi:unnamed protein product, partial [marine sediment metagenome]